MPIPGRSWRKESHGCKGAQSICKQELVVPTACATGVGQCIYVADTQPLRFVNVSSKVCSRVKYQEASVPGLHL